MATWRQRAAVHVRAWRARLWRLTVFSLGGWALALVGGAATLVMVVPGVILLPLGVGAIGLSGWRWAVHGVATGQRALARRMLGTDTPPLGAARLEPTGRRRVRGSIRRRRRLLASQQMWRETGYQYVAFVLLLLSATVVLVGVAAPLVALGIGLTVAVRAGASPKAQLTAEILLLVGVLAVPVTVGTETAIRRLTEWALGPSARDRLEERIATLERTRQIAVAAAEDERRRLERDLHDGAQAGMVAVAVQLGLASDALRSRRAGPDEAAAMVEEARRLALGAIEQVRTLARGLHPSVLSARGLAAALAGLATEGPVPVTVSCGEDLGLLAPETEAAAYFCAAEILANVYKHADAGGATVSLQRHGETLVLSVLDDGVGGAAVIPGGGLQGLVDRLAVLDGRLDLAEGAHRGTAVRVVLPAVRSPARHLIPSAL